LGYLLGRFAEQSGFELTVHSKSTAREAIARLKPVVVIFPSVEQLAADQPLVMELTALDMPILVCTSVAEEAAARGLGADFCLFHPLTLGDFQTVLAGAATARRT
jgi:hypothetical protein